MAEQTRIDVSSDAPFVTAKERYGIWPTTVWEVDSRDKYTKSLKKLIGDSGQNRAGSFEADDPTSLSTYRGKLTASIFSPALAAWALNLYSPDGGLIADPFAGGGTRAIVSAMLGHTYYGTEIREEEQKDVMARARSLQFDHAIDIRCDDGRNIDQFVHGADMVLTCPPYWNLEKYNGGENDLSMCKSYDEFLEGIGEVAKSCLRAVKPGATAVWFVGLHRDRQGNLLALNHDIARVHRKAGWLFREEIVVRRINDGSITRVGQFERGKKHLIRQHEYALVFKASA